MVKITEMLDTTQVSRMLGLGSNTVRRWSDKGIIKCYRLGERGDRRFYMADIQKFLKRSIPMNCDLDNNRLKCPHCGKDIDNAVGEHMAFGNDYSDRGITDPDQLPCPHCDTILKIVISVIEVVK